MKVIEYNHLTLQSHLILSFKQNGGIRFSSPIIIATVSVISSDQGNIVGFTMAPQNLYLINNVKEIVVFLDLKAFNSENSCMFSAVEVRKLFLLKTHN